jgi:hypothetical protein
LQEFVDASKRRLAVRRALRRACLALHQFDG